MRVERNKLHYTGQVIAVATRPSKKKPCAACQRIASPNPNPNPNPNPIQTWNVGSQEANKKPSMPVAAGLRDIYIIYSARSTTHVTRWFITTSLFPSESAVPASSSTDIADNLITNNIYDGVRSAQLAQPEPLYSGWQYPSPGHETS
jgi:hypothetical protein